MPFQEDNNSLHKNTAPKPNQFDQMLRINIGRDAVCLGTSVSIGFCSCMYPFSSLKSLFLETTHLML